MLVGDIYGGRDYTGIGLSANTIASSFGKVINQDKVAGQGGCLTRVKRDVFFLGREGCVRAVGALVHDVL